MRISDNNILRRKRLNVWYYVYMIGFLKGKVAHIVKDQILLDTGNIGFRISYPHCIELSKGDELMVYTYQSVSENDISLFGFNSLDEYDLFVKLISVKGIGPKMAMGILKGTTYERLVEGIENEDVSYIKSLPGVGNKTASQLILDLRGKIAKAEEDKSDRIDNEKLNDVAEALKSLGYKPIEIKKVIKQIAAEQLEESEYLRKALSLLKK